MKFEYSSNVKDMMTGYANCVKTKMIKKKCNGNEKPSYAFKVSRDSYLMCLSCFGLIKVSSTTTIDSGAYGIHPIPDYTAPMCPICREEWTDFVDIDSNIAHAISLFNKKGYKTSFCCEGHENDIIMGSYANGYIAFDKKSILNYIDYLPITWYLDSSNYRNRIIYYDENGKIIRNDNVIIRYDYCNRDEAIDDILQFAMSLPDISKED